MPPRNADQFLAANFAACFDALSLGRGKSPIPVAAEAAFVAARATTDGQPNLNVFAAAYMAVEAITLDAPPSHKDALTVALKAAWTADIEVGEWV